MIAMRARRQLTRSLLALAVCAATGCADDFVPFNRLDRLRILAVRRRAGGAGAGRDRGLHAAIYLPPGQAVASRSWSWCPLPGSEAEGSPCLVSEDEAAELAAAAGSELPPSTWATARPPLSSTRWIPTCWLRCAPGSPNQPSLVNCEGGFPVQIKLTVASDAGEELTAVRTLRLRFDDAHEPNGNPLIEGLAVVVGDDEVELGDEPEAVVPREEEAELRVAVPADAAESYTGLDEEGEPEERVERLVLTWFVESGDTENERTSFIDGVEALDEAVVNTWEPAPAEDYPRDSSQVVVVVRDERGGVTWRSGTASLGESP